MKTYRSFFYFFAVSAALAILFTVPPAYADQPHMRAALELLQSAKKSDQPLPMLNAAKKKLEDAPKNKAGGRKQALEAVNDAIAELRTGDKKKMGEKIDSAIANIHQGMDNAK